MDSDKRPEYRMRDVFPGREDTPAYTKEFPVDAESYCRAIIKALVRHDELGKAKYYFAPLKNEVFEPDEK